jgi:hypothetical protein
VVASVNASGLAAGTHTLVPAVQVPPDVRVDRVAPGSVTLTLAARPPEATASPAPSE